MFAGQDCVRMFAEVDLRSGLVLIRYCGVWFEVSRQHGLGQLKASARRPSVHFSASLRVNLSEGHCLEGRSSSWLQCVVGACTLHCGARSSTGEQPEIAPVAFITWPIAA